MREDAAVSGLYAAANGRKSWETALESVSDLLGLHFVQVLGIDTRSGQLVFSSHGGNVAPQAALDYFRHYNTIDPRVPLAMQTPADQWMHCHEHLLPTEVESGSFFQDFLIPYGARYVSATKLMAEDDVQFFVAMSRGVGSAPLTADEMPSLERLKHHFTEAFRNLVHLRETFAELGMARELLAQFSYPMILIDEMRGIWHRNAAAESLLKDSDAIVERGGYLDAPTVAGQRTLAQAVQRLCLSSAQADGLPRVVATLPTRDGRRFLAFLSAIRPEVAMGAFGRMPRALVIFHDIEAAASSTSLDALVVGECFDLTPAQARVAVQLVEGASVNEIAQRSRKSVATVQSHVKGLMAKAEVERQVDLVRKILALPVKKWS